MDNAGRVKKLLRSKTVTLVAILLLIVLFFWFVSPRHSYLSIRNITSILNSMALYILFAVGVSMPILLGEFDLSPGYVGTASGALMAKLLAEVGVPWYIVITICLLLESFSVSSTRCLSISFAYRVSLRRLRSDRLSPRASRL